MTSHDHFFMALSSIQLSVSVCVIIIVIALPDCALTLKLK